MTTTSGTDQPDEMTEYVRRLFGTTTEPAPALDPSENPDGARSFVRALFNTDH